MKTAGTWIMVEEADAAGMNRSIPMEKARDDCMVAFKMNGEALRPEQGYPLRLVVPGWEGNMWVKWIRRIEVGAAPWMAREETSKYTDLLANGVARRFTWEMDTKSVITSPQMPITHGKGPPVGSGDVLAGEEIYTDNCSVCHGDFGKAVGRRPVLAQDATVHTFDGSFDDATFGVESAIAGRGLVVDWVSHVGDMLARTGQDLGSDVTLFDNAEISILCSATLSRKVMEADPANIAFCPYSVYVAERDGAVTVGYRNLPEGRCKRCRRILTGLRGR